MKPRKMNVLQNNIICVADHVVNKSCPIPIPVFWGLGKCI